MMLRFFLIGLLCCFGFWGSVSAELNLPDLGNPSDRVLSLESEREYRQQVSRQMHQQNFIMTDPIVAQYIDALGHRLASVSGNLEQSFEFHLVPANVVNASAYPGGLIVIYSGLLLETDNESELAGVVAHEIAHVNQRHISRMLAKQQKSTAPLLLGMLAAFAAAQSSSNSDAPIAAMASMQALHAQMQINFTRYHEQEADRIGIQTLYDADFDPQGMADFFAKLMRKNQVSDARYQLPEYLRTHPLSVNRVTEAKQRIKGFEPKPTNESLLYDFIKERVRVLTADEFDDVLSFYQGALKKMPTKHKDALNYGYALALFYDGQHEKAQKQLRFIKKTPQNNHLIDVLEAQTLSRTNQSKAYAFIKKMLDRYVENPIVLEASSQILLQLDDTDATDLAIQSLRKLILQNDRQNPKHYELLSIAYHKDLRPIAAGEAAARRAHLLGRNYHAVRVLKNLKKRELDYYQRAKIDALIAKYEPLITKKERQIEQRQRPGTR